MSHLIQSELKKGGDFMAAVRRAVAQLHGAFALGIVRASEPERLLAVRQGSPLVVDGVMYLHSPFPNKVFAVDIDTQKILWKYEPKQDAAVIAQMCCDTVNRGVAYAENKVILQQADSTMVVVHAPPLGVSMPRPAVNCITPAALK